MPKINVEIKNLAQIRRAFDLAPSLMGRELGKAIKDATIYIGREAVKEVTSGVNRALDTGRLRASIQGGTYSGGSVSQSASGTTISRLRGEVGPSVHYAIYVHEGTRYMRARPFMETAVENSQEPIQRFFTDAVDRVLNAIGKKT